MGNSNSQNPNNEVKVVQKTLNQKPNQKPDRMRDSPDLVSFNLKQKIYDAFYEYYGNLIFTKVENKRVENKRVEKREEGEEDTSLFSVYCAKMNCMLCLEQRYLIVVTPWDKNSIGTMIYLKALPWISFQTRTFKSEPFHDPRIPQLKSQTYPETSSNKLMNDTIEVERRFEDKTVYISYGFPIKVELLNQNRKRSSSETYEKSLTSSRVFEELVNEYPDKTNLKSALEYFNTIVILNV